MIFEADYDEIKLQIYSYNVTLVTSSPLRHRKNVTKITSQKFFQFGPFPIKNSGYTSAAQYVLS